MTRDPPTTGAAARGHLTGMGARHNGLMVGVALCSLASSARGDDTPPEETIEANRPREGAKATERTPSYWPAPLGWHEPPPHHGRQGEGGLVISGIVGRALFGDVRGARLVAASRVGPSTRFGGVLSFTSEANREFESGGRFVQTSGWQATAGPMLGWGAPWNDVVVGFMLGSGVAFGSQRGRREAAADNPCRYGEQSWELGTPSCISPGLPTSSSYVGGYASASFVIQIPWRWRLRPVFGITQTVFFLAGDGTNGMSLTADAGLVWQAF